MTAFAVLPFLAVQAGTGAGQTVSNAADRIRLGDCELDLAGGTLSRSGKVLDLRAKSFALLRFLAQNAGTVLSKSDLMDAVWPDVAVTEDSLTQTIRDIRVQLGDAGAALIRTVARRGYMLDLGTNEAPPVPVTQETVVRPDTSDSRLRIAILPFRDRTGRSGEEARIEMLNEEIAAGLVRFRTVVVLSPSSAAAVAAQTDDPTEIAGRLRADYLVTGTARPAETGFFLSLQLVKGGDGEMIWSETFDCTDVADTGRTHKIPRLVVGQLSATIEVDNADRALWRPTDSLTALDHLAKGMSLMRRADPAFYSECLRHFEMAVAADPGLGLAHSFAAWADLAIHGYGLAPRDVKERALKRARQGAETAPNEARSLSMLGYILLFNNDYDSAETFIRQGLKLNPYSIDIMFDAVCLMIVRGRPQEALDYLARIAEVSLMPVGHEDTLRFEALYMLRDYDGAARAIAKVSHLDLRQRVWTAAIAAMRGDAATARRELAEVARADPGWDHLERAREGYPYERPEDVEHMLEGIRRALDLRDA